MHVKFNDGALVAFSTIGVGKIVYSNYWVNGGTAGVYIKTGDRDVLNLETGGSGTVYLDAMVTVCRIRSIELERL